MPGVGRLPLIAIDETADAEIMNIASRVARGDPGAERRVRIEGLAEAKLRGAHLPGAFGDIIADAVAEDVRGGVILADMPTALSDDRNQFDFIVGHHRTARDLDGIIGPVDRSACLGEPDLVRRGLHARLSDMIGIVEANGEDLARARNRCEQANRGDIHCLLAGSRQSFDLWSGIVPVCDQRDHVRCQAG